MVATLTILLNVLELCLPLRLGGHTDLGSGMTAYSDKQAGLAGEQNKETERKKKSHGPRETQRDGLGS